MAAVDLKNLPKNEHDELCCVYAALILHDDGLEITVNYYLLYSSSLFIKHLPDLPEFFPSQ
jgi:hypothetical protein